MDNAQKLAILPMWVIDRIKEEMRLSPAAWQVIIAAVEQAEVPQTLPCEVKLPPGTVIGKGVPVSTLMLAIAQRERYPVHAQAFAEQHQGEPSAPVACDEREAFEAESLRNNRPVDRLPSGDYLLPATRFAWQGWQARAARERKPSALVAQLQADLTARDQQIDALSMDAGRYRWLRSRDLETISKGGVFAGLTPDNLVLNEETLDHAIDAAMAKPKCRHCGDTGQIMLGRSGQAEDGNAPIMEPCEDCDRGMPDLASRPEERGTPETEPCSGCGTPGWTGACNKCIPY
ncbi:MAG: hypothetical protein E6R08_09300 [Nevskiaceae bacterium]|nr:MAG: hypothetical protein E6R08_09300 [Nevskiaceae bacterium]